MRFDAGLWPADLLQSEAASESRDHLSAGEHPAGTIVENEITYLSVLIPHEGGDLRRGILRQPGRRADLLRDVPVKILGDLDTHGFAIYRDLLFASKPTLGDGRQTLTKITGAKFEPSPTAAAVV
jgi:hypothetical protein